MLTLKLKGGSRTRIVEAGGFTIYRYNAYAYQVTAHDIPGQDDRAFYVGDRSRQPPTTDLDGADIWYESAFVENANAKTTEVVFPDIHPLQQSADAA